MSKKKKITYIPTQNDVFFFDCNIWIYLLCPIGDYQIDRQNRYSDFLTKVIENQATILVNSILLSEFYNLYMRLAFKNWQDLINDYSTSYKKDYSITNDFAENNINAISLIKLIIRLSEKKDDAFTRIHLNRIYDNLVYVDFNDCYFVEFCKNNSAIMISNDYDYNKIPNIGLTVLR